MIVSWMRSEMATAPMGCAPLVSALAMVMMSGVTPKLCAAKFWPVRPRPVITSSNTSTMPCWSQISRSRARYPFGGTRQPVDPAMGSTKHGGDVLRAVQVDEAHEILGELDAVLCLRRASSGSP